MLGNNNNPGEGRPNMQSSIVACASSLALLLCMVAPARADLTLTAAGVADGFSLSLFASGFPHNNQNPAKGPGGTATTVAGNVLVTDFSPGLPCRLTRLWMPMARHRRPLSISRMWEPICSD